MDEQQYQLAIRKMSTHELVTVICGYRNELRECRELLKEIMEISGLNKIQETICGQAIDYIDTVVADYRQLPCFAETTKVEEEEGQEEIKHE